MKDKLINLKLIKSFNPCKDGLENFIKHHKEFSGSPLELLELENVSVLDKFWLLLRNEFIPENDLHKLGCKFAESVLHIYEEQFPNDKRPRQAIEAKRKFIKRLITKYELDAAAAAARDAARAAETAAEAATWDAARDAAAAAAAASARDAARAAETAAGAATWDAARDAAGAAAGAARYAARDAAKQKQLEILKEYFNER